MAFMLPRSCLCIVFCINKYSQKNFQKVNFLLHFPHLQNRSLIKKKDERWCWIWLPYHYTLVLKMCFLNETKFGEKVCTWNLDLTSHTFTPGLIQEGWSSLWLPAWALPVLSVQEDLEGKRWVGCATKHSPEDPVLGSWSSPSEGTIGDSGQCRGSGYFGSSRGHRWLC